VFYDDMLFIKNEKVDENKNTKKSPIFYTHRHITKIHVICGIFQKFYHPPG